jgi:coenzyme F420-dependent glucose-6-phosphate dehydrogenase
MAAVTLGFHCSHEQLAPSRLLADLKLAAQAGFTAAMCSDHFRPWSERDGDAGFAWSWLGSALEATALSLGTVCAPGQRYHPAVIAQAAATLAEMYPGRFWLAVGSGEALNESITGDAWPAKHNRNARLKECADVLRALWAGETVSLRSHITVVDARLYCLPAVTPLLLGAALTPDTARWVGGWADGLITVAGPRHSMRAVVEAFREGGGAAKPMFLQVAVSFAPTDHQAASAAYAQWRHCALPPHLLADLDTPAAFDAASDQARLPDVLDRVRASADVDRHLDSLYEDCELGFERIYLHNVATAHQCRFIEQCGARIIPALRNANRPRAL